MYNRNRIIIYSIVSILVLNFVLLQFFVLCQQKRELIMWGVFVKVSGQVSVLRPTETKYVRVKPGDVIYEGDKIKVGTSSKAAVVTKEGVEIKINQETEFLVEQSQVKKEEIRSTINLFRGMIYNKALGIRAKLDVKTPAGVCSVRGTEYQTEVDYDGTTSVIVISGMVEVKNEYGVVVVKPGEKTKMQTGSKPEEPQKLDEKEIQQKTSWQQEVKIEKKVLQIRVGKEKGGEEKIIELRFRK
jgi:hypothetical protein